MSVLPPITYYSTDLDAILAYMIVKYDGWWSTQVNNNCGLWSIINDRIALQTAGILFYYII